MRTLVFSDPLLLIVLQHLRSDLHSSFATTVMYTKSFLISILLLLCFFCTGAFISAFQIKEASIDDIQHAFKHNQLTSSELVEFYIKQIQILNPLLRGVIEVNPDAVYQAKKADQDRAANKPGSLSALHGIPILLKDNIATKDKLNTTAGSFALLGSVVPRDSGIVVRLRRAGAVILGKASMTEWAGFRSRNVPPGFCGRSGQGKEKTKEYGQENLENAESLHVNISQYKEALLTMKEFSRKGMEKLMKVHRLDALVTPRSYVSSFLAIGGYPGISVPAGFDNRGVPFGICFSGLKGSEPTLIEIAYGFEQATKIRKPPSFKH